MFSLHDPLALGETQVSLLIKKSRFGMDPSSVHVRGSCSYKQKHLVGQEGFLLLVFQAWPLHRGTVTAGTDRAWGWRALHSVSTSGSSTSTSCSQGENVTKERHSLEAALKYFWAVYDSGAPYAPSQTGRKPVFRCLSERMIQALSISRWEGCLELFSEMWEVGSISRNERKMRLGLKSDVQGFQDHWFLQRKEKTCISQPRWIERRTKMGDFVCLWLVAAGMGKEKKTEGAV